MPRKNKTTSKHKRYVKPDYHSQNNADNINSSNIKENKKNKLRTSYDVYKRLIHDPNIGIDLNYVSIGYQDTENTQEMPLLDWRMIDDGGDIPMHRINYFVLYLLDGQKVIIWDKKSKLDRLYCSGETNKNTESLRSLLFETDTANIPKSQKNDYNNERDNKQKFEHVDEKCETNILETLTRTNQSIAILNELLLIFNTDLNGNDIILKYNKQRVIQEPQLHTKLKRNEYKIIANKTKQIIGNQCFIHPKTNQKINIKNDMEFSYVHSELYSEKDEFKYIDIDQHNLRKYRQMEISINHETTLDCAYRLRLQYGAGINMCLLNFSSAKNPGGGWDTGALAQEESIARSSTLIPTLIKYQSQFYGYHRKQKKTMLYSHALIYSPDIVIMNHGNGVQIKQFKNGYYKCDIITSPAVNAGMYVKRAKTMDYMMKKYGKLNGNKNENIDEKQRKNAAWNVVKYVMTERCKRVLELAMKHDNECVVLGAWGCGVFGNKPNIIAMIFADLLKNRYHNVFRKVVFAILDHKKKQTMDKFVFQFEKVFGKGK